MPHKVYVGNYPMYFVEDDVLNLFQDYEGVELAGFFKLKNKCYSFLHCMNERQLIEIIVNLHDIDVCGRNLIVRAADENLHKKIQKSMLEHGTVAANVHPRNTCDINYSTSDSYAYSETGRSKQPGVQQEVNSENRNTYPKKYQMSTSAGHSTGTNTYDNAKRGTRQNNGVSNKYETQDYSSHYPESNYSPQQNVKRDSRQNDGVSNTYENHDYSTTYTQPNYSPQQNVKRGARQNDGISNKYESQDHSSYSPESGYSTQQNNHSASTYSNGAREKYASSYGQHVSQPEGEDSGLGFNPQETFSKSPVSSQYKTMNERFDSYKHRREDIGSTGYQANSSREYKQPFSKSPVSTQYKTANERFDSYKHNREDQASSGHQANNLREHNQPPYRNTSESSLETVHNVPSPQQYEKLNFVSVMNFPLRMPVRDLYKLFSDFNPIKVFIVCNEPRVERTPTEAVICFESEKDATEAILTLDNTVYRGRVLLVTDAVDMSLVNELLSFG